MSKTELTLLSCCIAVLNTAACYSQKLGLNDLHVLSNKTNWESVNHYLLNKGWEYFESEKGSSLKYNTIVWSYARSYNDEASGWFRLYTYDGLPSKIVYEAFNKNTYSAIQNALSANGYRIVDSEIKDDELLSSYSNKKFTLSISTDKRSDDIAYSSEKSITGYSFLLVKKAGIYDPDNGPKTDYWEESKTVRLEYTLKDGKLEGLAKRYFHSGVLESSGHYINGLKNGEFKEYNGEGVLQFEYTLKDEELHGASAVYNEAGVLTMSGKYSNGQKNGLFNEFSDEGWLEYTYNMKNNEYHGQHISYSDELKNKKTLVNEYVNGKLRGNSTENIYREDGSLKFQILGHYIDGEESGKWQAEYIDKEGTRRVFKMFTYVAGELEGQYFESKGDSLVFGTYKSGILHGPYKAYLDISHMLFGGVIRTDTANMNLACSGSYYQGLKVNEWRIYGMTGTMTKNGSYSSGKRAGLWTYYYPQILDHEGNTLSHSGEQYLTENYKDGMLEGLSVRRSRLVKTGYMCDTSIYKDRNPYDTCYRMVYQKANEHLSYSENKLHGVSIVKDSANVVTFSGRFYNGKKDGEWLESYVMGEHPNTAYMYEKGEYQMGRRHREWIEYRTPELVISRDYYNLGQFDGLSTQYNSKSGAKWYTSLYKNGKLLELEFFDSTGTNLIRKYEILIEHLNYWSVRYTEVGTDTISIKDYHVGTKDPNMDPFMLEIIFTLLSEGEDFYVNGQVKLLKKNGLEISSGYRMKEVKYGSWTTNYPDQNVQIQQNFFKNTGPDPEVYYLLGTTKLFNGVFEIYDKNTQLSEIRKVKEGLRNGNTTFMDLSGSIVKKEKYKEGRIKL